MKQETRDLLKSDFPAEALSEDKSRGFPLTSIKAAFVVERLNDALGLIGEGWWYSHAPFQVEDVGSKKEVITEVAFQYAVGEGGVGPITWDATVNMWSFSDAGGWSMPIFCAGGNGVGKGSVALTDARKSAVTDGLTKAASMLGVGHKVFKGQTKPPSGAQQQASRPARAASAKPAGDSSFNITKVRFDTTYKEIAQGMGPQTFKTFRDGLVELLESAGYTEPQHRSNLLNQLFGTNDLREFVAGWFLLLERYGAHVRDNAGGKDFAKHVVVEGVERQLAWDAVVENVGKETPAPTEDGLPTEDADEVPQL